MTQKKDISLDIFIIETPGLRRSAPIRNDVGKSRFFKIVAVPAFMLEDEAKIPRLFASQFFARYGRQPLAGEFGCLLSHRAVWKIIAERDAAGIVFEDDARDIDGTQLEILATKFLKNARCQSSILTFHDPRFIRRRRLVNPNNFMRLRGSSSHAVAYLITPFAAQKLIESSVKFASVADWPSSKITYWVSPWLVNHGDENTPSVISSLGPRDNLISSAGFIEIFSLRHYFENRSAFSGFYEYYNVVISPRLKSKADSILIKLLTVKYFDNRR
jgi:hypothetical protein